MMKAKKRLLQRLIHTYHWLKSCCRPMVRSSAVMTPMRLVAYAPMKPNAIEKITRKGIIVISPRILGSMMKLAELIPIISRASICCVTRIVPISEAMFDPTLPASIRHIIELENSRSIISRVV